MILKFAALAATFIIDSSLFFIDSFHHSLGYYITFKRKK